MPTARTVLVIAVSLSASPALADRPTIYDVHPDMKGLGTPCVTVPMPASAFTPHVGQISKILYLERCKGGCTVIGGSTNDARTMTSAIPPPGTSTAFPEFANHLGETGAAADAEWSAFVSCVREVYSFYDVTVTDVKPTAGLSYHLNLVSGTPSLIGLGGTTLGISPFACDAQDNIMSFAFAGAHAATTAEKYVKDMCWTSTHEAGHAFSLEHEHTYLDGTLACNDPMTYLTTPCDPQRYFRLAPAKCGGFDEEPCVCGATQSSHLKLLGVFGPGSPAVPPPTVSIVTPTANAQLATLVNASAGSRRGVDRVELFINGAKWGASPGAAFGAAGQPDPSPYAIRVDPALPGGVVDVQVRAYDDLGRFTDSAVVTALKGSPCQTADTCAAGQRCEAGKCFWDPPVGEFGEPCTFSQYCVSGLCQGTADLQICTQTCVVGSTDSCPTGLDCVAAGPGQGICFPPAEGGGCCSADDRGMPVVGFGLVVVGLALRRRRQPS